MSNADNNLVMVFDTETTDRTDFKASYDAPQQPNLLQLGYKVYDIASRAVIFEVGHLVNTTVFPSWKGIAAGAQEVHKIQEAHVMKYGLGVRSTADAFLSWAGKSSLFVAHNAPFDIMVMQCFLKRAGYSPDFLQGKPKYCTMTTSTNICQIPNPNGRGGFKWPKLNEAYPFFCGKPMDENAHNALVDVNACGEIFWRHVERQMVAHIGTEGFARG